MAQVFTGMGIVRGEAQGEVLVSPAPVAFALVEPGSGAIGEHGHPLRGVSIAGKVLVFPRACGSSSGSYMLLRLAETGTAPIALVSAEPDALTAAGAVLGGIPFVCALDCDALSTFRMGDSVIVDGARGTVRLLGVEAAPCA